MTQTTAPAPITMTVDQVAEVTRLLGSIAEWDADRDELVKAEENGEFDSDDWHDSDDAGVDLAREAGMLLRSLLGLPA